MFSKLGKKIVLLLVLILAICWTVFFLWTNFQQKTFLVEQLRRQALGIYHYIVLSRLWISGKGGIYIKNNDQYTLVTPSEFIKQLSKLAEKRLPYSIHIAVKNAKDPDHVPDEFEKHAIEELRSAHKREVYAIKKDIHGKRLFRYAAPLSFATECASCHQGLLPEQIPGCIAVAISAGPLLDRFQQNKEYLILYLTGALAISVALLFVMLQRFVLKPLATLNSAAKKVRKGDMSVRVNLTESDEWKSVGESFNQMVEALAGQQKALEEEVQKAVSQLSEAYEELKRTEKYRSDFYSNVTHDLKTPITAIQGATDLLKKKIDRDDLHLYIDMLDRNTKKLSKMVKDLLDIAKIESGGLELHMEEQDLIELIEDAIFMVTSLAIEKQISISQDTTLKSAIISGDQSRLEQVFINLLSNAISFSPNGSVINVIIQQGEDGQVLVIIEDSGPGIPRDEREKIFQKFFRGNKGSSQDGHEGMGLGLAIAKGIVEVHGGKIWVSEGKLGGAAFYISFPLSRQEG